MYYLKEKKQDILRKKKLDTDFKNSLGCAVSSVWKTVESKTLWFRKILWVSIQFNFLYESSFLSKLFLLWGKKFECLQNMSGKRYIGFWVRICKGFGPIVQLFASDQKKHTWLLNIDSNWKHDYYMIWNGNEVIKI